MTNSFNYLKPPDIDAAFSAEAARQNEQTAGFAEQAKLNRITEGKNKQSIAGVLNALGPLSKTLSDIGAGQIAKQEKELSAKAMYNHARGYHTEEEDKPLDAFNKELDKQSSEINGLASKVQKEDGDESILAEELYQRNPRYRAAVHRIQLQQSVVAAAGNLDDSKESLTITGEDGEELSYDSISKASDMSAWMAKWQAKYIEDNYAGVITDEAYAQYVSKPLMKLLYDRSNSWAIENGRKQKAARLETAAAEIAFSLQTEDGNSPDVVQSALISKVLNVKQIADVLQTQIANGQIDDKEWDKLEEVTIKKDGKDVTISEVMAQYWPGLERQRMTAVQQQYEDIKTSGQQLDLDYVRQAVEIGENSTDGRTSENVYEEFLEKWRKVGHVGEPPELKKWFNSNSAEALARKEVVEEVNNRIQLGTFQLSELHKYDPQTRKLIQQELNNSPKYSRQVESDKVNKKAIRDIVSGAVSETVSGKQHYSVGLMQEKLIRKYENQLLITDDPDLALDKVLSDFEKLKDKNEDSFITADGFTEFVPTTGAVTDAMQAQATYYNTLNQTIDSVGVDAAIEKSGLFYKENELKGKINLVEQGSTGYTNKDFRLAHLAGLSHPSELIQRIAKAQGIEMELPPTHIQVQQDIVSAADRALMTYLPSYKSSLRAFANQEQYRGLPVRPVYGGSTEGDYSEANAFSESYGKLSRVITGPEGTSGADGYRTMFGGSTFDSFSDHPRKLNTSNKLTSDAAGKYQFLSTTWDEAAAATGVTDFSPRSQEIAARYLIQKAGIDPDAPINSKEELIRVMNALSPVWASLPDTQGKSRYNQPVASHDELWKRYQG